MPAPKSLRLNRLETITEGWEMSAASAAKRGRRPTARRSVAPEAVLPAFLTGEEFIVLDANEARPQPGRRGLATAAASVQIAAEIDAGAAVFVAATQPSGAISFHFPQRAAVRSARRGAARTRVTFDIPAGGGAGADGRRGLFSKLVRVVLVKIAEVALGALSRYAAQWAVPLLAKELERRLWKDRAQGWVRVTEETLADPAGKLPPGRPDFRRPQRGLLLVHGTFSHAHSGFRKLVRTRFFAAARALYGERIYAFNHFTISKTPAENVAELLDALPEGEFEFDVITHSRGGLVARELLEGSGLAHPHARRLKIGRVIMVACPSAGTPLGSPEHWDEKLSFLANVLDLLPDNPFTTAGAWLAESLKWVAANVLGHCPGLVAMDPRGETIAALQQAPAAPAGTSYHAVVSNFEPDASWLGRLADMGVDRFFEGANDLVVPTEGGWKTGEQAADWVRGDRIACLGPGGNLRADGSSPVHHVAFFGDDAVADYLIGALQGNAPTLPRIDLERPLPARAARAIRGAGSVPPPTETASLASLPAPAAAIASAAPASTIAKQGWDTEYELRITVVSQELHTHAEADRSVPLLIAEYGSARVTEPFYLRGEKNQVGERWRRIIAAQRRIVQYANGGSFRPRDAAAGVADYPDDKFLEDLGHDLFCTLFPGEVRHLYNVARFRHDKRRLKLTFTSMIPWIADLPWELAYDRIAGNFLSCADVRFVRNVLTPTPANAIRTKNGRLRILVVSAQPAGLGELSIEEERRGIHESFRPLIDAGLVHVEVLAAATPGQLQERLRYPVADDDIDVLHFIGHGEFDETSRTGTLIFQDEAGRPRPLTATSFLNILRGRDIRVVFLNACETGRGRHADYNRGVAMALVKDGIPAVVANQYSVIDRSASLFSLHFYACLAKGLRLGDAMREARIALHYCGVEPMDWAVPVLFAVDAEARLCAPVSPGGIAAPAGSVLSRRSDSLRRRSGPRRRSVAVWDAENALAYREHLDGTLEEFNAMQDAFAFQLERFTAPRGLWSVEGNNLSDGVAYLRADRVVGRMERIRQSINADFLFCVTELPLRDGDTPALYYYVTGSTCIFSTWDLHPRLSGPSLRKAIANHLAIFLLDALTDLPGGRSDADPEHPIHTVGYWNNERRVDHIAGPIAITPAAQTKIEAMVRKNENARRSDRIGAGEFAALQQLLALR